MYKAGSISEIIAKANKDAEAVYEPTLCKIFKSASSKAKVYQTVLQDKPALEPKLIQPIIPRKDKRTKDGIKITNKDAAEIRVEARNKSKKNADKFILDQEEVEIEPVRGKKRKSNINFVFEQEGQDSQIKKKSKKKKTVADDDLQGSDITSKKKGKKSKAKSDKESTSVKPVKNKEITEERSQDEFNDEGDDVGSEDDYGEFEDDDEIEAIAADSKGKTRKQLALTKQDREKELSEKNSPKEKNPELENRTIFIGNIPIELEKRQLAKIFKNCGTIESIRFRCATRKTPNALKKVAVNKKEIHPERSSFVAYIRFSSRKEAEDAMKEHNGLEINEHHLTIDMADNTSKSKDNKKGIFIGNLHIKLEDDDLWKAFQDCGKILGVRIVRDSNTGIGKGVGFVNFESNDAVEIALLKDGNPLKGREMRISRISKKQKLNKLHSTGNSSDPRDKRKAKRRSRPRTENWKKNNVKTHGFEGESQNNQASFAGDHLSEIGKLKRKSRKFNKGEAKKTRIAKFLLKK